MCIFCLCVYSFVICWPPLGALRPLFVSLGRLWIHFGSLRTALGLLLDPFGCHGGPLGLPSTCNQFFDKIGRPIPSKWLSSAQPAHKKWPAAQKTYIQFRADGSQVRSLRTKNGLLELCPQSRGSPGSARSATCPAAPNPP